MARISPKKKFRDFTSQYLRHPGSEQLLNTQEGPPIMEMPTEKQRSREAEAQPLGHMPHFLLCGRRGQALTWCSGSIMYASGLNFPFHLLSLSGRTGQGPPRPLSLIAKVPEAFTSLSFGRVKNLWEETREGRAVNLSLLLCPWHAAVSPMQLNTVHLYEFWDILPYYFQANTLLCFLPLIISISLQFRTPLLGSL